MGGKEKQERNISFKLKKKISVLKDGSSFGLYNFITGQDKTMSAQSNKFSQIVKINRSNFLNIIKNNKIDYEKFMEIKDRALFDKNYKPVKELECLACNSQDHMIEFCNKIFFDKTNVYIFHHSNYSPFQERCELKNRRKKELNSLSKQSDVQDKASKYSKDNNLIDSSQDLSYDSAGNQNQTETSDDDESQTENQSSNKEQLSAIQEEKAKQIKKKKYSLSALKSFDITSIQSENLEDGRRAAEDFTIYNTMNKSYQTKQTEKEYVTEFIGEDEINNFFRTRTKSYQNLNHTLKKGSVYKINSDQDVVGAISPGGGGESSKYNMPSNLDTIDEKCKITSQTNFAKSPQSPPTQYFYDGPPIPSKKSILINDKEEIINNQVHLIKSQGFATTHSNLKPRHSIHFMNSQFLKKLYNHHQNNNNQEDLQQDEYFEWKFEKIQEYQNYFVYFNYLNVIKRYNGIMYNRNNKRKKTLRTKSRVNKTIILKQQKAQGASIDNKLGSRISNNLQQGYEDKIQKTSEMINDLN